MSTAECMLTDDQDKESIQAELAELQNKWSSFHLQVGQSQKSIDLSIKFFKLVEEVSVVRLFFVLRLKIC